MALETEENQRQSSKAVSLSPSPDKDLIMTLEDDKNCSATHCVEERVDVVVDSGACVCGLPLRYAKNIPLEQLSPEDKESFSTAASGETVEAHGKKTLSVQCQNGVFSKMGFTVMDIRRALGSVSRMVHANHRVVFDSEENGGSYILDRNANCKHKVYERNGVYILPVWLVTPKKQSCEQSESSGFTRPVPP